MLCNGYEGFWIACFKFVCSWVGMLLVGCVCLLRLDLWICSLIVDLIGVCLIYLM